MDKFNAATSGSSKIEALLAAIKDPNKDRSDVEALFAAMYPNKDTVQSSDIKALLAAIKDSNKDTVQSLVNSGILIGLATDIDNQDSNPLELAIKLREEDIALVLIAAGATTGEYRQDDIILKALNNKLFRAARRLFERADQEVIDKFHSSPYYPNPLIAASQSNNVETVEILIDFGAEVDFQDKDEKTALFAAVQSGHRDVVEALIRRGAGLDLAKRDGKTPFDIAIEMDQPNIVALILDAFCSANGIPNKADFTLDKAVRDKEYSTALQLLETGADFASRVMRGRQQSKDEPIVGSRNGYLKLLFSNIVQLTKTMEGQVLNKSKNNHTGSDRAFFSALSWLTDCLTQHPNCIYAEGPLPLMPSRVIDVGPADGSRSPFLYVTKSTRGRYIALSHRWGESAITKTTKKNLSRRLAEIKFKDLTRTMQDAVTITRRLGVRYLWIDAICIIQDSHNDWSVEACDMANIYRNAVLTIAAASAADHSQGCFTDRSATGADLLDSRGWILQEQLLSQRVLKYSFGRLEWECISLSATESDPANGSNPSEVMRFKRALGGFRSTSMTLQKQAHASWQHIVEAYSHRTLTNDADKLMAVMGIAKFTGNILQDTFLAGLWEKTLWRDLLWSSDLPYGGTRLRSIKLPTWSWASVNGGVSYKLPSGGSTTYVESMLELVSAEVYQEIANGDVGGRLVVKGPMIKIERGKGSRYDSTRLHPDKPKTEFQLQEQSQDPDMSEEKPRSFFKRFSRTKKSRPFTMDNSASVSTPEKETDRENKMTLDVTYPFWPDVENDKFESAWLLPIASQYTWIHCLVLVPIDRKGLGHMTDYRRVGLCHVNNLSNTTYPRINIFDGDDKKIIGLV